MWINQKELLMQAQRQEWLLEIRSLLIDLLERSKEAQTLVPLVIQRRRQLHQPKRNLQRRMLRELRAALLQKKSKPRLRSLESKQKKPKREDSLKLKRTSTELVS
jgi:hypothetical protein